MYQENDHKVNRYALITGASKGLGLELARKLAARKYNLLLISLPGEKLEFIANQLAAEFGVACAFLEEDLAQTEAIGKVVNWVKSFGRLEVLVNNAGIGGTASITQVDPMYIENMLRINIMSLSLLTYHLIPILNASEKSYILNVASMASFSPIGYKTVYPASKAFVLHFSLGLKEELRDRSISVSVVTPGPMKTNERVTGRIEELGRYAKIGLESPQKVAEISIEKMFKGKSLIIPSRTNYVNFLVLSIIPLRWRVKLLTRPFRNRLQIPVSYES